MVQKIPEGYHTITPTLIVEGAADAIALYAKAFGATEDYRATLPDSDKIMHAAITIGTSKLFLMDISPMCPASMATASNFYLYLEDVDAAFTKAKAAGLEPTMEPADMFYGDRIAALKDNFGVNWTLATHVRDVSPEEIEEAKRQFGNAA